MPQSGDPPPEPPQPDAFQRAYGPEAVRADLRGRSVRGGVATLGGQAGKFVLTLAATVVLARVLGPREFGLVAMVAPVTGLLAVFQDLGLSAATVQRRDLDHGQVSTLFWVNVSAGLVLGMVTAALAPAVAWFYGEPILRGVTAALGATFLLTGLGAQHVALLRRTMRFGRLAVIDMIGTAVGAAAGVTAALAGWGVWSLVAMQLATLLAASVGLWIGAGWRPGAPRRHTGVRSMLRFGGELTGFNALNHLVRTVDKLVVGRWHGSAAAGLYSRAYALLMLPLQQVAWPVQGVVVSGLSRLQDEPERFRTYYRRALGAVATVAVPLGVAALVMADQVVLLVLGEKFQEAGPLFRLFGVAVLVQPVLASAGWLLTATARTGRLARWGVWAGGLLVASYFAGAPFGPEGVAAAFSIAVAVLTVPCVLMMTRGTPVPAGDVFRELGRQALTAAPAAAAGWALVRFTPGLDHPAAAVPAAGAVITGVHVLLQDRLCGVHLVGWVREALAGVRSGPGD